MTSTGRSWIRFAAVEYYDEQLRRRIGESKAAVCSVLLLCLVLGRVAMLVDEWLLRPRANHQEKVFKC